jgi:DNA-binding LytR/AlgR family response regulator
MKKEKVRILVVEDDMIIGANISLQLTKLGYEITGIETRGEEAIGHVKANRPDLLLMDINLKGSLSGIDTVKAIQKFCDVPVIYLTANSDEVTFKKAKETYPKAFMAKPFNKLELQRTIELVTDQLVENKNELKKIGGIEVLGDRIFVRHHGKMEKILLDDILFIEADRNYCTIVTDTDKFTLTSTLKTIEEKLPKSHLVRIHRSYIVNISKLDIVADHHLEINRKVIPLGRSYKELLLSSIQTI